MEGEFGSMMQAVLKFRDDRDWGRFHVPKDVASALAVEAAEVLDLYQWDRAPTRQDVGRELCDVLWYVLLLAHEAGIDLSQAFAAKLRENEDKYPVEKSSGTAAKYSEL